MMRMTNRYKPPVKTIVFIVASAVILSLVCSPRTGVAQSRSGRSSNLNELRRLFQHPPDDARIMMRWWWFGPAVMKPEIERELRQMKAGGIGGVEVQPVYPLAPDDPASGVKNLPYLSDEFLEALRFASDKARELGMRFDLTVGSGWPYGGPSVPITEAAGRLRIERVKVTDTTKLVKLPSLSGGEKLLAVFLIKPAGEASSTREIDEFKDGAVCLPKDTPAPFEIQFFVSSRTGMQVKRAAAGAEGFVVDHLDRVAINDYLRNVGDRLLQALGDRPPYAVFCDSLEVYNSDWTGDFLAEFQKRRGYDVRPHLTELAEGSAPRGLALRHDWGLTVTELLNERFVAPLHEWARKKGTRLRIQHYGPPGAVLSSNAYADLPEGEGFQWQSLSATRWASSASHIYGHPVTSSETWTWLHSPTFRATPLDMKAEADRHFLQGINQLIGHGWPYSPPGVEYPGWRFYAAAVFNEKNPWFTVMPDVASYLQRVSWLLRQGQPVSDVALYLPNDDAWSHLKLGNTSMIESLRERLGTGLIPRILDAGYNFDFFDDQALNQAGRLDGSSLVLGENRYRAVILPSVTTIPEQTLVKLEQFARAGGILIATGETPSNAPGFQATAADHQKVAAVSRRLFEGPGAPGHLLRQGPDDWSQTLNGLLQPDAALTPAAPEIGYVHRRTGDADVYFLANTGNVSHVTTARFRVAEDARVRAEFWDPLSGEIEEAPIAASDRNSVSVSLRLEPYESRVLVFSANSGAAASETPAKPKSVAPPLDLSSNWEVTFGDGPPKHLEHMEQLRSWTAEPETSYYSGLATYEKTFTIAADLLNGGAKITLDFGETTPAAPDPPRTHSNGMRAMAEAPVREAAVVWVNGRRVGSVWCPPFTLDVTRALQAGANELRIVVANTAVNFMAGHSLPDYRLLTLRYGERFQPQDMDKIQPLPSGLLGPIRLNWVAK
jgi:hypothetical protein